MDREYLLHAFAWRRPILTPWGEERIISRLEHEDGSCFSFNVTVGRMSADQPERTFYVRTTPRLT